jgi:hypothetical protein
VPGASTATIGRWRHSRSTVIHEYGATGFQDSYRPDSPQKVRKKSAMARIRPITANPENPEISRLPASFNATQPVAGSL